MNIWLEKVQLISEFFILTQVVAHLHLVVHLQVLSQQYLGVQEKQDQVLVAYLPLE
jgi:hypothetical protein